MVLSVSRGRANRERESQDCYSSRVQGTCLLSAVRNRLHIRRQPVADDVHKGS